MKYDKLFVRFHGFPVYQEIWKFEIIRSNPGYFSLEYVCRDESQQHFILSKSHISSDDTEKFQISLSDEVHIENWYEEYSVPDVLDGIGWDVGICMGGKWYWHHGLNSFPEEWPVFCKLLSKYTKLVWPPKVLNTDEWLHISSAFYETEEPQ